MKMTSTSSYQQRLIRVCEYIHHNLDKPLSLEELSDVAAFSKFHFHRIFSANMGLTLARFVQLNRLKRACFRLAFEPQKAIIDIALEAGFNNAESFSRGFKRQFKQTPSQFRAKPNWQDWQQHFTYQKNNIGSTTMDVQIVHFETTKIAYLSHIGPQQRVYETAAKFIAWRKATGLSPIATSKTFGIPHSDPNSTPEHLFRWDVCGSVNEDVPDNDYGVKTGEIPGGSCAVLRHKGSHDLMEKSIYYLYNEWLPQNNQEPRDYPCFFHYLNFIHQIDEWELKTDIYIPIK